ncbi:tyrosine-type recombinase/integrase [Candidatus Dojkabacteria bacterium]|uniref:Tyrosine-type recombinase/integrase n=1 Tax=Candidatus Dojkabacteria bacterium TaxID=2099670 RepID=A0A955I6H9_9BACT|nr:tyrosine-type recombinase/integrase [Candidatus Dojkabacteria bacterium]
MDFTSTLSLFEKNLEQKGRSKSTITAYRKDLDQLVNYLKKNKISQWSEINNKILEKYFQLLQQETELTPKTISRKINSTKTLFKFLISIKQVDSDYSINIKHPKIQRQVPRVLSPLEYKALRDTARSNIRLFTMIEMLLQTGMRIGELSRLEKQDINDKVSQIKIRAYSSYPERSIPVNPSLNEALTSYMKSKQYLSMKSKFVFFTRTGNKILIRNIRSTINNAFKSTGIKDATVNDLRNTFIIFQLENGLKLDLLAEIVGHKRQTTTEHYLEYIQTRTQKTTSRITPL